MLNSKIIGYSENNFLLRLQMPEISDSRIHSMWLFGVSLTCALFTLVFNFVILLAYHKLKGTKPPPGPKRQPGLAFKALCLCHTL